MLLDDASDLVFRLICHAVKLSCILAPIIQSIIFTTQYHLAYRLRHHLNYICLLPTQVVLLHIDVQMSCSLVIIPLPQFPPGIEPITINHQFRSLRWPMGIFLYYNTIQSGMKRNECIIGYHLRIIFTKINMEAQFSSIQTNTP